MSNYKKYKERTLSTIMVADLEVIETRFSHLELDKRINAVKIFRSEVDVTKEYTNTLSKIGSVIVNPAFNVSINKECSTLVKATETLLESPKQSMIELKKDMLVKSLCVNWNEFIRDCMKTYFVGVPNMRHFLFASIENGEFLKQVKTNKDLLHFNTLSDIKSHFRSSITNDTVKGFFNEIGVINKNYTNQEDYFFEGVKAFMVSKVFSTTENSNLIIQEIINKVEFKIENADISRLQKLIKEVKKDKKKEEGKGSTTPSSRKRKRDKHPIP
jgi:hypothetical protein